MDRGGAGTIRRPFGCFRPGDYSPESRDVSSLALLISTVSSV